MCDEAGFLMPLDKIRRSSLHGLAGGARLRLLGPYDPITPHDRSSPPFPGEGSTWWRKAVWESPFAESKVQWKVRYPTHPSTGALPDALACDFHAPSALTGQDVEHGLSVFASGKAATLFAQIFLIQMGVPKSEAMQLSSDDLHLTSVALTHLRPFGNERLAYDHMRHLVRSVRYTHPHGWSVAESHGNLTLTVRGKETGVSLQAYNKSRMSTVRANKAAYKAIAPTIVREEAHFYESKLEDLELTRLEAWRDAHENGLYRRLHQEYFAAMFDLRELKGLRRRKPRNLSTRGTPLLRKFADWYFAGGSPASFPHLAGLKDPVSALSNLRVAAQRTFDLNVDVPWAEHVPLLKSPLMRPLACPPEFEPPPERIAQVFCRDSWPDHLKAIKKVLDAA
jgi:hypothetical protein